MATTVRQPRRRREPDALNGASRFRRWSVPPLSVLLPVPVVVIFYIYPFISMIITSFTNTRPLRTRGEWVNWENYQTIITEPRFRDAAKHSLIYAVCVVPLMVLLPLLLALLVRDKVSGIGFFRAAYYVPAICSIVVTALSWRSLLQEQGPVNNWLRSIGLIDGAIPFLSHPMWILVCAMIITLWTGLPYYMIMYLTALKNVDRSLYEAVEIDGAGAIRRFFTITVPGVRVMMYLVGVLTTINSLKIFTEVFLIGGANSPVETVTMYIRSRIQDPLYGSLGEGTADSVLLFIMTFGFIMLSNRLQAKAEEQ
ncbi:ABC transporter permease [Bowdeniella nasicola]|uniref:ABC transporter permease n=1 Tax=Bowdeniella nasicola TaxID=208480 RepID=A0A1Q5Q5H5_9ACTO|nr:sugar ABC transporter permease [Bowdeniella nasicola]OKL55074.1 ABC transporter permease [Bowdeniella nasicola]